MESSDKPSMDETVTNPASLARISNGDEPSSYTTTSGLIFTPLSHGSPFAPMTPLPNRYPSTATSATASTTMARIKRRLPPPDDPPDELEPAEPPPPDAPPGPDSPSGAEAMGSDESAPDEDADSTSAFLSFCGNRAPQDAQKSSSSRDSAPHSGQNIACSPFVSPSAHYPKGRARN